MSEWMDRLLNEPVDENGWALALLIGLALLFVAPLVTMWIGDVRRRKQETMSDNQPGSRANWPTGASDDEAARIQGMLNAPDLVRERIEARPETLADVEILGGPTGRLGEDDGEAAPAGDPESERLEKLSHTDPGLIVDPLGAPFPIKQANDGPVRDVSSYAMAVLPPSRFHTEGPPPLAINRPPTVSPTRTVCPHCEGTGHMPSISDHLRASIALVGDTGDQIVQAFYAELLSGAPDLAALFPPDLLTTDETHHQRDRLLKALVALADLYDPADPERMERLDTALKAFGRNHAAFARPDGTVRGATLEEYAAVKSALFSTLRVAAGGAWRPEYTASWTQAYDYAAAVMLAEQYRSAFTAPRFPRG